MMNTLPITKALAQFDEMIDEMADVCHALKQEKGAVSSDAAARSEGDASIRRRGISACSRHGVQRCRIPACSRRIIASRRGIQRSTIPACPRCKHKPLHQLHCRRIRSITCQMEGIFVLATTNEDGSPDAAIFVPRYSMKLTLLCS